MEPRSPISLPAPGPHGGDALRIAETLGLDPGMMIDLSVSMNPFAPDVRAIAATRLDHLVRYPDPSAATERLAGALDVDPRRLVLTNGGAEAIALVATIVERAEVVEPEFSLYRRHLPEVAAGAPRWRSNPSNPLGALAASDERAAVWDEAFYQIATGTWTRGDDDAWRLGSLTKLWNCPGLRLGYAIAPDVAQADVVRARQPRWSVNGLALALVEPLLAASDLPGWADRIASLRGALRDGLRDRGFAVDDTAANWVLVHSPQLRERLAPHGIVVRDCASFGLPGTYRVALPDPVDLSRVLDAFEAVAADG